MKAQRLFLIRLKQYSVGPWLEITSSLPCFPLSPGDFSLEAYFQWTPCTRTLPQVCSRTHHPPGIDIDIFIYSSSEDQLLPHVNSLQRSLVCYNFLCLDFKMFFRVSFCYVIFHDHSLGVFQMHIFIVIPMKPFHLGHSHPAALCPTLPGIPWVFVLLFSLLTGSWSRPLLFIFEISAKM